MQFRIFNAKNFTTLTITSLCFNQDVCNSSQFCNYVSIRKYAILDSFSAPQGFDNIFICMDWRYKRARRIAK
jgi:hypothetical protein